MIFYYFIIVFVLFLSNINHEINTKTHINCQYPTRFMVCMYTVLRFYDTSQPWVLYVYYWLVASKTRYVSCSFACHQLIEPFRIPLSCIKAIYINHSQYWPANVFNDKPMSFDPFIWLMVIHLICSCTTRFWTTSLVASCPSQNSTGHIN